jgi:hypothetical protein
VAKIITNHQYRNLTYGYELSDKEKAEFDYIDEEEMDMHNFLRYRGEVIDFDEFLHSPNINGWDGIRGDSFFSGVVVKIDPQDSDRVMCGLYLA